MCIFEHSKVLDAQLFIGMTTMVEAVSEEASCLSVHVHSSPFKKIRS
jgi:hypothetical protein